MIAEAEVATGAQAPEPGTAEWARVVTASKISAITGESPWESQFSLWHTMAGTVGYEPSQSKAIERGNALEGAVLDWFYAVSPTYTEQARQVYFDREGGVEGATLDSLALSEQGHLVPVEAKTAARGEDWGPEGSDLIPPYYLTQVDWQLSFVPEAPYAYVAALLGPNLELRWYKIPRDEERIEQLVWKVTLWRWSLEAGVEPPLDRSPATFGTLKKLHPDIEQDEEVELDERFTEQFITRRLAYEEADGNYTRVKSEMLKKMGSARRALFGGKVVARRQANAHGVSLIPVMKPDLFETVRNSTQERDSE